MKRVLLALIPILLCQQTLFSEKISLLPEVIRQQIKKDPPFRLDRQKKVIQGEIEILHQEFDSKSTLSYDVRFLDTGERVVEKNNYLRLHPGALIGIATAVSSLELLGRDFAFKSSIWIKEPLSPSSLKKGGVYLENLYVDLLLDPHLNYSNLLQLAERMKHMGIQSLEGKILFAKCPEIPFAEGWDLKENHPLALYLQGQMIVNNSVILRSEAFLKALKEKGIAVKDSSLNFIPEQTAIPNVLLAEIASEPLVALLLQGWQQQDKVTFEALMRAMGEKKQKSGKSLRLGVLQMRDFLSLRALLNADEMALFDGSGTSTLSLLSAKQFTSLFLFAKNQFHLDADFLASLPMLKLNPPLKGPPAFARAIVSTQGNIVSVAGIMETKEKRKVAFCCIVNHAYREKEKAENFLKAFCQTLYDSL